MKQRLLYAILMLFGVFSMAKAENTLSLTIPKGEGKVKITVTGEGFASTKHLVIGSKVTGDVEYESDSNESTQYITLVQQADKERSVTLSVGVNIVTSLTINGKVTSFDASDIALSAPISTQLTSLSFSENAGLTTLELKNSGTVVFPKLKKLVANKNNLNFIPNKTNFAEMPSSGYQIGIQTPTGTITWDGGVDEKASNTAMDLIFSKIKVNGGQYLFGDNLNGYYYKDWKVKNSKGEYVDATGEAAAHGDATYPYRYMFYDASTKVYASAGEYKTTLVFTASHPELPNVQVVGIPVKVTAPIFKLTTPEVVTGTSTGSIEVMKVTDSGLADFTADGEAKDTQLQITFAPKSGYSFDRNNTSLWSVKGLKDLQWTNNVLSCKIKGDVDVEVKASFVGESRTVTFSTPEHGKSVDVYILNGKKLNSGDVFPVGSKLEIIPTPEDGYKVGSVKVGSTENDFTTIDMDTNEKYVTGPLTTNVSIIVTFVPDQTLYKIYWDDADSHVDYKVKSGAEWNRAGYHQALKDAEIVFTAKAPEGKTLVKVLKDGDPISNESTEFYRFIMPDHDVNITAELETEKVLNLTASSQEVAYTGSGIPFTNYTITQSGTTIPNSSVDEIVVWYKTQGDAEPLYTRDLRKNCGTYDVKITRVAKDGYKEIEVKSTSESPLTLKITPAMPQTTPPTSVSVVETKKTDGTKEYKYQQTGATVKNVNKYQVVFVKEQKTKPEDDILYEASVKDNVNPHKVLIRYMVMVSDTERDKNYQPYYLEVPVTVNGSNLTTYKVTLKQPTVGTLKMYNGENELSSGSMVATGTQLTFKTTGITNMSPYKIAPVDDQGNINTNLLESPAEKSTADASQVIEVKANMTVAVVGTAIDLKTIVLRENRKKVEFDYDGDSHTYPLKDETVSRFAEKSAPTTALTGSSDPTNVTVSYFYNNTPVIQPKEAGTYKVVLTAEANTTAGYAAFSLTDEMVIKPVDPAQPTNLSATSLSIGQKLSQSQISGKAPVEGTFEWVEKDKVVKADYEGYVRFIPKDTRNYNSIILTTPVSVDVDSKLRVVYAPVNGTITVKDKNGKEYAPGTEVTKGLELTITAKANTGYYFESMTINDTKYTSATRTLTVGDVSVSIEASFKQEAATAVLAYSATSGGTLSVVRSRDGYIYSNNAKVDLNTQLTVTATANTGFKLKSLTINGRVYTNSPQVIQFTGTTTISAVFEKENPESVILTFPTEAETSGKGFMLNVYGAQSYDFGKEITLVVSTLAEDAKNIVVKAGSTTVAANKDGSYTIKADAEKSISVSLSKTPTPLKVAIEMVTKNAKGYVMGHVEIIPASSLRATTPTYYYGDKVTLIAYPESGVTFLYWSDSRLNKSNVRTITLTKDIDIKPVFSGVPTDVESIESAEVIGGDDCIIIRGVADARVTIVSMDGRSQQQMVNGDTRINVRAGVYGVILEQGKAVIREKIVVR